MTSLDDSFLPFLAGGLSPWHVAESLVAALESKGAKECFEDKVWNLEPGQVGFVRRNNASVIAVRRGTGGSGTGWRMAGAHTDSPGLRVRNQGIRALGGLLELPTEIYGGPIVSTWIDRELVIAGVMATQEAGTMVLKAIQLPGLEVVIPNAAIHLNRDINKGFEYNPHIHLRAYGPLGSLVLDPQRPAESLCEQSLGLARGTIQSVELCLADKVKPTWLGPSGGLFVSPRIDNLAGCHGILAAFEQLGTTPHHQLVAFFDHEEIGSNSRAGASSSFLTTMIDRWNLVFGSTGQDAFTAKARSTLLSVDAAHAWHPSYGEKHDGNYAPIMGQGIVVKANVNHKYATEPLVYAKVLNWWQAKGIPIQQFKNRADMGCGSTIGPISEALSGISTLDVGIPMLAMHSIRETAHMADQRAMVNAVKAFLGEVQ